MLHLTWGEHDSKEAIQFARELDETCATRWICYYHPSLNMAGLHVACIPAVKRAMDEKRKELFGDTQKPYAMVCASEGSEQDLDFWRKYQGGAGRTFHSLEEAYDWLGLSEAARAVASATIQSWELEVTSAA
jgi:hypothetical protein